MMRFLVIPLLLLLAMPARAQVLVVPAGEGVVVPPRSAMAPVPRPPMVAARRRRLPPEDVVAPGPVPDRAGVSPALLLVPLAAAAVLAATLSAGNEAGGHSGPVRTR